MTEQAQRIAIAKWMGWTVITSNGVGRPSWSNRHGFDDRAIPDYTRDLNAMAEVEERLTDNQWRDYATYKLGNDVSATAAQRAEALLRTLNLWTDDVPETTTAPTGAQPESK